MCFSITDPWRLPSERIFWHKEDLHCLDKNIFHLMVNLSLKKIFIFSLFCYLSERFLHSNVCLRRTGQWSWTDRHYQQRTGKYQISSWSEVFIECGAWRAALLLGETDCSGRLSRCYGRSERCRRFTLHFATSIRRTSLFGDQVSREKHGRRSFVGCSLLGFEGCEYR